MNVKENSKMFFLNVYLQSLFHGRYIYFFIISRNTGNDIYVLKTPFKHVFGNHNHDNMHAHNTRLNTFKKNKNSFPVENFVCK